MKEIHNNTKFISYLTFKLGEETFAANVGKVINILEMTNITSVPKSPDYMMGVINLRGSVLPVIDTRQKFGMEETELTSNTCIIVMEVKMESDTVRVGTLVDSVEEVIEIEDDQIQPPPAIGNKYRSEFIKGMVNQNETFIMILDMDKVFSLNELSAIQDKIPEHNKAE